MVSVDVKHHVYLLTTCSRADGLSTDMHTGTTAHHEVPAHGGHQGGSQARCPVGLRHETTHPEILAPTAVCSRRRFSPPFFVS